MIKIIVLFFKQWLILLMKAVDPLTVSEKFDIKNARTEVGGKDYLVELATSTPSAANLEAYSEIIKQNQL